LRQFGAANFSYVNDWDGWLVQSDPDSNSFYTWPAVITVYAGVPEKIGNHYTIWHCPSATPLPNDKSRTAGYTINDDIIINKNEAGRLNKVMTPSLFVLMLDASYPYGTHQEFSLRRGPDNALYCARLNNGRMDSIDYRHNTYKQTGVLHVDGSTKLHRRYTPTSPIPAMTRWRNNHGLYLENGTFQAD
jgi:hypothetical protein